MKIYVAAPLFSPVERAFNEELCRIMEPYFDIYLPQRDGILLEKTISQKCTSSEAVINRVYEEDIAAIRSVNLLLAVFDGRTPDEGVCVEVGYAKALGIEIIGFKSDTRIALPWGHNPMISGCVDKWIKNLEELRDWAAKVSKYASIRIQRNKSLKLSRG